MRSLLFHGRRHFEPKMSVKLPIVCGFSATASVSSPDPDVAEKLLGYPNPDDIRDAMVKQNEAQLHFSFLLI